MLLLLCLDSVRRSPRDSLAICLLSRRAAPWATPLMSAIAPRRAGPYGRDQKTGSYFRGGSKRRYIRPLLCIGGAALHSPGNRKFSSS